MSKHFALKNNQMFVLAEAAGGVYNSDQLRTLCEIAENESAFLKVTEDQRIGFMLDPSKLPDVQAQVRKIGLLLKSYKSPGVPSPRACLGELCTYSHQPSLGDALELTTHLLKSFPNPKHYSSIGVNGCGRACLGSSTEDVHIVAEESGYKISIGGKGSDLPQQAQLLVENVARTDLPIVIEKILDVFYKECSEGERIHDVIERVGLTPFIDVLPEHVIGASPDLTSQTLPTQEDTLEDNLSREENSSSGLSQMKMSAEDIATDALIDDLLDRSSQEFDDLDGHNGLVNSDTHLDPDLLKEDEISLGHLQRNKELEAPVLAEPGIEESTQIETGLLEEAEFEDGTLEDVERVRDAIRSELSMSSSDEIKGPHAHTDLLDEIEQEQQGSELLMHDAHNDALSDETSDSHSAAVFEHQSPTKTTHLRSESISSSDLRPERGSPTTKQWGAQTPVSGRLAIKFEGEQLGIELPSGMCFELPFDAVPEGAEFSMVLPDGELRMERDGAVLNVKLGMLSMRFPIPKTSQRRAA